MSKFTKTWNFFQNYKTILRNWLLKQAKPSFYLGISTPYCCSNTNGDILLSQFSNKNVNLNALYLAISYNLVYILNLLFAEFIRSRNIQVWRLFLKSEIKFNRFQIAHFFFKQNQALVISSKKLNRFYSRKF